MVSSYVSSGYMLDLLALRNGRPSMSLLKMYLNSGPVSMISSKRAHAVLRIANTRMRWTTSETSAFGIRRRSTDGKHLLVAISEEFGNHGGNAICRTGIRWLASAKAMGRTAPQV
jgi:hypothetical protein